MSEFLKPCPFCGSEQIYIYYKNVNYNKWVTVCGTCLARAVLVKQDLKQWRYGIRE